jgi:hypothetical protein
MANQSFAATTTDWEQLLVKVTANAADLTFLEGTRNDLAVVLQGAREANARQATFKAEFQQATRDLEENMARGRELATRLRNGIRTRYGLAGEKLADFKLRPRRTKTKAKTPDPLKAPAPTTPATPATAPATPAAPDTQK